MVARREAGRELDHAEDRPVRQRRGDLAQSLVGGAVVVGRKALRGPDVTGRRAGAARRGVLRDLVDLHDRPAVRVVARDDPSHLQCHVSTPWRRIAGPVRLAPAPRMIARRPRPPSRHGPRRVDRRRACRARTRRVSIGWKSFGYRRLSAANFFRSQRLSGSSTNTPTRTIRSPGPGTPGIASTSPNTISESAAAHRATRFMTWSTGSVLSWIRPRREAGSTRAAPSPAIVDGAQMSLARRLEREGRVAH